MKKLKKLNLGKGLSRVEMKNVNGGGRVCECSPGACYCVGPNNPNLAIQCAPLHMCVGSN